MEHFILPVQFQALSSSQMSDKMLNLSPHLEFLISYLLKVQLFFYFSHEEISCVELSIYLSKIISVEVLHFGEKVFKNPCQADLC